MGSLDEDAESARSKKSECTKPCIPINCCSGVVTKKLKYTWKLEDFMLLRALAKDDAIPNGDAKNAITTPNIAEGTGIEGRWYLRVRPYQQVVPPKPEVSAAADHHTYARPSQYTTQAISRPTPQNLAEAGSVSLFLVGAVNTSTSASLQACVINTNEEGTSGTGKKAGTWVFSKENTQHGILNFIKCSDELIAGLLVNGSLIIQAKLRIVELSADNVYHRAASASSFLDDIKLYATSKEAKDVAIKCKNVSYVASKFMLCARSEVFYEMFSNGFIENEKREIAMDQYDSETVKHLLQYIHTDKCTLLKKADVTVKDLIKLLKLAEQFQLHTLVSNTIERMEALVPSDEIYEIIEMNSKSKIQGLDKFIMKHLQGIPASELWLRLNE